MRQLIVALIQRGGHRTRIPRQPTKLQLSAQQISARLTSAAAAAPAPVAGSGGAAHSVILPKAAPAPAAPKAALPEANIVCLPPFPLPFAARPTDSLGWCGADLFCS